MPNITYDASGSTIAVFDASLPAEEGTIVYNPGDMAFIILCATLVFFMSPGIGFLYSGLLRRKNALSMLFLSLAVYSVATVTWFFWGYSLTFSDGSAFIGDLKNFGLMNVLDAPSAGSSKIPALLFCLYQSMFAGLTPTIATSGVAERARILPILVWTFLWASIVYAPVAHWTWCATGWSFQKGDLDFAGGGPVHITSGTASLVWSFYLGKRRGYGTEKLSYRPHSTSHVVLGTAFLYFGWFGFNAGSALSMSLRAVQAGIVTNIAAAFGGLAWVLVDLIYTGKYSAVSICSGIVAGLVGITPAAGFVGAPASLAIGFVTAVCCNYATSLKVFLRVDDAVDGFALHGVGGFVGCILTALFADSRVAAFDGFTEIPGGWINKNYVQLGWQLASACAVMSYTAVVTYILLFIIDHIPGLKLRADEDAEVLGMDETMLGELSYDYVAVRRDLENAEEVDNWKMKDTASAHSSNEKKPTASV
ncbi:hypothetical protein OIV83_003387 [Microbotryomycetes sp. JL201]|nr:hypothetical protein OIV83_003387 [Microbotryomycetes sp. JL201]